MAAEITLRDPNDDRRSRSTCIHLNGNMRLAVLSDGSMRLESNGYNVVVTGVKNFEKGFHLEFTPYEAVAENDGDNHQWRPGVCLRLTGIPKPLLKKSAS